MKLKTMCLLAVLLITGCGRHTPAMPSDKAPYKRWKIYFYYPKGLNAIATHLLVLNKSGRLYTVPVNGGHHEDKDSVGGWYDKMKVWGYANTNASLSLDNQLPINILFCWDSFVDHKLYQTEIQFSPDLWQKMQTPPDHLNKWGEPFWYNTLMIGLAPEGKTKVWLQDDNNDYPNIPVTPVSTVTKSGEQAEHCNDIYKYIGGGDDSFDRTDKKTEEFMKDKTYPYGNW